MQPDRSATWAPSIAPTLITPTELNGPLKSVWANNDAQKERAPWYWAF